MPTQAKEIPTAKASILTAMPNNKMVFMSEGLKWWVLSSPFSPSYSMRPPKKANRPKAIQWSKDSIRPCRLRVPIHPNMGMSPWKSPKESEMDAAVRPHHRRWMMPLVMATVKQSIANANARSQISNEDTGR